MKAVLFNMLWLFVFCKQLSKWKCRLFERKVHKTDSFTWHFWLVQEVFECVSLMVHLFINPEVVCGVSSLLNSSKTHWTLKAVWLAWYCKSFLVVWELRINLILNWHVSGNSYRKRLITSVWGLNITDFYLLYICDWGWRDFLHSI